MTARTGGVIVEAAREGMTVPFVRVSRIVLAAIAAILARPGPTVTSIDAVREGR
jgi:hypothetical protein